MRTPEVYYILSGTGRVHVDDETAEVEHDDTIFIPPNSRQFIENTGAVDLTFLCIVDPAWRKEDEILDETDRGKAPREAALTVGIIGSMQFSDQMREIAGQLRIRGHEPILSAFVESFIGKDAAEQERIKLDQKNHEDAMRVDLERLQRADAILVLNLEKNGTPNYIGGNTFLEMGLSHVRGQRLFLWNPIPDIPVFRTEIEAMRPTILNGNLANLR